MTDAELLKMLEINLEIVTDFMDADSVSDLEAELTLYLESAKRFISLEGIKLNQDDFGDCQLIIMYSAWLYEIRRGPATVGYGAAFPQPMPRMLRWNLNNRLYSQKVEE